VLIKSVPIALTITACVFSIMMVCMNVYHDNSGLGTACVLVTGWSYMAALRTVYAPLNLFRKVVIYGMNVIFFIAAVLLQDLLALKGLEFGIIVQVFILMTISPIIQDFLTNVFIRAQHWWEARRKQKFAKKEEVSA
jgi:cation-transporting ATPase E